MTTNTIHGEPLPLLLEAIAQMEFVSEAGGHLTVDAELERRLAEPFLRALRRVEARQLAEEASIADGRAGFRTAQERAALAFTALVVEVCDASKQASAHDRR
jgi:hypothetical protein